MKEEIEVEQLKEQEDIKTSLKQTPVDEFQIHEHPVVHFRTNQYAWLDAIVRYLVPPKESGRIKTRLTKKLLDRLNAESERVLFPKSNLR